MKSGLILIVILVILASCSAPQEPVENSATDIPSAGIPNPASLYCEQNGNKLEIQTAADGSQTGVCIFPDGSTCDEWAYFRGECGMEPLENPKLSQTTEPTTNASGGYMQPGTSEPIADWWGVIKSAESGSQYDDYFERQDLGGMILFGIDSKEVEVKSQIEALRDSGTIVHLYGTLFSNMPDFNGSQIQVDRIEAEE